MTPEANFVTALTITLVISAAVVGILWRYLDPVLVQYCGSADRGRLWTLFSSAIIFLVPLFALSLNLPPEHAWSSWVFPLAALVRWPLFALLIAVAIVAVVAAALHIPREVPMTRAELDDLRRLLDKVQELRARELISRLEATRPVNPKELDELNRLVDKVQAVRSRTPGGRGDAASTN
jgi:hypothetical protein